MVRCKDMDDPIEPANLRFLRRLVTLLTAVMICGVVVVIALLVTRLNQDTPTLPDQISLPEGVTPRAFTQGPDWYAIVTTTDQILIYSRLTGALQQTLQID